MPPLPKHKINYPKRLIHYRGGVYPIRRVTYYPVGSPQFTVRKLVGSITLLRIIEHEQQSPDPDIREAAKELGKDVTMFVPDVLFDSPEVIADALNAKWEGQVVVTHVS